ncbi:hypothetical protein ACWGDX_29785 [Streptomyces sp. NPDC055025]
MNEDTVTLHGGPLDGRSVVPTRHNRYGILFGRNVGLDEPAYEPDRTGLWIWRGGEGWPGPREPREPSNAPGQHP